MILQVGFVTEKIQRRVGAGKEALLQRAVAAESRHIGQSALRGKCGKETRRLRRKELSAGFPCCPRLGQIDAGEDLQKERRADRQAFSFQFL